MEPMLIISGYVMLAAAVISCYKAAEQVLVSRTEEHNRMLLALLLCTGYFLGPLGLFYVGAVSALPAALFFAGLITFIAFAYWPGPSRTCTTSRSSAPVRGRTAPHLAPAAAAGLFSTIYILTRDPGYRAAMQADFFRAPHELPLYLLMSGAVAVITGYTVTILAIEISVSNSGRIRRAVRSLIAVTAGLLLSPLALFAGFIRRTLVAPSPAGCFLAP